MKRKCLLVLLFVLCFSKLTSETYSSYELIPAGHWLYDAYFVLMAQEKKTSLMDSAPVTVAEFEQNFYKINYENLSESAKNIYDKIEDYLNEKKFCFNLGPIKAYLNLKLNPILMFKSNNKIDWSFATDYSGPNNSPEAGYGTSSNYMNSKFTKPIISAPIRLTVPQYFIIDLEPFIGKNFWSMTDNYNFSNLPLSGSDFDFLWPRKAYASTGLLFENWGVNLHIAKEGLQIGKTQTGSIIYNSTFETDAYVQLNIFSEKFKYILNAIQVGQNRYMYLHQVGFSLFNKLKLEVVEGTFVNAPFELRFLNPLMIMHSFGAWEQYISPFEEKYFGEAHICQYLAINFSLNAIKNVRIYGLFAMNEIQFPNELGSPSGDALPNSLGGQLGIELTIPYKQGWFLGTLEGVYTSPYFYIKQGADWSLYSKRRNMQGYGASPICSWIGTPFGPDSIGAQIRFGYNKVGKWNAEFDYLFVAHGINSFGLFNKKITVKDEYGNDIEISGYYPSVLLKSEQITAEQAKQMARQMSLNGTVQYTNELTLKGSYSLNEHFSFDASFTYTFIFNNHNVLGDFEQGIQMCFGAKYMLF